MLTTLPDVIDFRHNDRLRKLLIRFDRVGGVLDYVPFSCMSRPSVNDHQRLAVEGMETIKRSCELWAERSSSASMAIEQFFKLQILSGKPEGRRITFSEFWGSDDIEPKKIGTDAWSLPTISGYKTAFFHPPYGLRKPIKKLSTLFDSINCEVFGSESEYESIEVFSWSTDWSNYFEAGHEWWGTYFWTVYSPARDLLTVIGGSSTD